MGSTELNTRRGLAPFTLLLLLGTILSEVSAILVKKSVIRTAAEEGTLLVEVKNDSADSGNVTITTLIHSLYGDIGQEYENCTLPFVLEPEELFTCSFTVQVPADAVDVNLGTLTASGFDDEGAAVTAMDDEVLTYCAAGPTQILALGPVLNTSADDIDTFLIGGEVIPGASRWLFRMRLRIPRSVI